MAVAGHPPVPNVARVGWCDSAVTNSAFVSNDRWTFNDESMSRIAMGSYGVAVAKPPPDVG